MTRMYVRGVAALAVVIGLVGCSKGANDAGKPASETSPAIEANLTIPSWFASIPQDTPYLIASLEPPPLELAAKFMKAFEPLSTRMVANVPKELGDNRALFEAAMQELQGKWSVAGMESLGFSTKPRYAMYGLGLQPAVLRLEVKDSKVLQATIERIATKGGKTLPAMETKEGRSFWRIAKDDITLVISLADNQLIAAVGKTADVDAKLGLILGIEKPAQGMADGKQIKDVMARHGVGPLIAGYVDTKRIVTLALAAAGRTLTPTCTADIDRLTSIVPRLAFGYQVAPKLTSGALVFETSAELRTKLAAVKTVVPGFETAMAAPAVMAMGAGIDLAAGQKLGSFVAENVQQLATACALDDVFEEAGKAGRALAKPIPDPFDKIQGGVFSVQQFELDANGAPDFTKMAGFALLGSSDAKALLAKAVQEEPQIGLLGIASDGKLHDLPKGAIPVPLALSAGVSDKAIIVTAGDGKVPGAKVLESAGGGGNKAPLMAFSYDYAKLLQWQAKVIAGQGQQGADAAEVLTAMGSLFGRATMTIDVTDQGLSMSGAIEIK